MTGEPSTVAEEVAAADLRRRVIRGGTLYLAVRLVLQLFQWMVTLLVARLLLPDDYGLMTTGMLFVGLADTLAEAGVSRALVHKKELATADLAQGFTLSLGLSGVLYLVLYVMAEPAAAILDRPNFAPFLRVLALLLWLIPFEAVPGALLERNLRLGQRSAVRLVGVFSQAVLVWWLAWAGYGYWALAAGALAGRLLQTAYAWYASGWRPALAWPAREAWELLRYGLHVCGATLLWFIYENADFAVLGLLLGPVALGYYALAFQLISLPVEKLTANVNQVTFAVFCKLQHDRERVRSWFLRLAVLLSFVAMPALIGLALVADDALPLLLGQRWRAVVLPFQLLCPVGALMVVISSLSQVIGALGRPDVNLKYNAACALLFPAGFFLLGWYYGIVGVCLAWLSLYPLLAAGLVHLSRHITGIGLWSLASSQWPVVRGVIAMTICVLAMQWSLAEAAPVMRLMGAIASGVVSYSGWMLATARRTVWQDVKALWRELRGNQE